MVHRLVTRVMGTQGRVYHCVVDVPHAERIRGRFHRDDQIRWTDPATMAGLRPAQVSVLGLAWPSLPCMARWSASSEEQTPAPSTARMVQTI
jgi:hypothetical protein